MIKIMRYSQHLELAALIGIDSESEGLARAARLGIPISAGGVHGLRAMDNYESIQIVFDATSAQAHLQNFDAIKADGKKVIDLTPAAIGPYTVPVVNADSHSDAPNVNMVTCGGQATIPIIHAIRTACTRLMYAEIVASIASKSAGPGTRANIDEFTETTAKAIEVLGGAERGKAVIVLNPAEPPVIMRDTIFTLTKGGEPAAIEHAVEEMVAKVQEYVPGYSLHQEVQFEHIGDNNPIDVPGLGPVSGLKSTVFIKVEGAGHYLPTYAGNLDIMTSAAMKVADQWASASIAR